jgi:predicted NUDIX family phosphoesterase
MVTVAGRATLDLMFRDEQVFIVDREAVFDGRWPQGFVPAADVAGRSLLQRLLAAGRFVPRAPAEAEPAWKQLIPYCMLARAGQLFVVRRTSAQSEARLHGRLSIGLGGHLGPADGEGEPMIANGLERELREEIFLPDSLPEPRFLGLLNDDQTEVGRVHCGLVFRLDLLPGTAIRIRETHKMSGRFHPLPTDAGSRRSSAPDTPAPLVETPEVWQDPGRFESWSRLLLEARAWRD